MLKSIIHIGVSENDNRETVEIKRIAIVMGMLMSLAAAIWGVILIYHKEYLFAIIPFGYVTVTIFNLITLNVSKKISVPRFVQLFFSISLPFILQWLLGGFISSGGMMLWSLIGLVGSLVLHKGRFVYGWLILYCTLLFITLMTNNVASLNKPVFLTEDIHLNLFMLNIAMISVIGFMIGKIKVDEDFKMRLEVEAKNIEISNQIAQQKLLTKQLATSNEELRKFSYIISHDLKSPLRTISSLASLVLMDNKSSLKKDSIYHIESITQKVKRLYSLIEGILSYSKIKLNSKSQTKVKTNELVNKVIDFISPPNNIEIIIKKELPDVLYDESMLYQIFQNLLDNAVNFMDKPKGTIYIDYYLKDNMFVFIVSDNGLGINEKHHVRIFDMFQMLSEKNAIESTGIGLSITKKIVEINLGKIWLESSLGEGATFYFSVPS